MRATGIVRRLDDLGRVVIPKEIRRNMKIKEGDPLEIYTTKEGVCLVKYENDKVDWDIARRLVRAVIPNGVKFAIYNRFGDLKCVNVQNTFPRDYAEIEAEFIEPIKIDGDIECYIVFDRDDFNRKHSIEVLKAYLEE